MDYIHEAFKQFDALNEDVFDLSDEGIEELKDFQDKDEQDIYTQLDIIDKEAQNENELKDSYIGDVILDCIICHSKMYKDKDDVTIDENSDVANIEEECPVCGNTDGFKIIGEVAEFKRDGEVEDEEEIEVEDELHESIKRRHSHKVINESKRYKSIKELRKGKELGELFDPNINVGDVTSDIALDASNIARDLGRNAAVDVLGAGNKTTRGAEADEAVNTKKMRRKALDDIDADMDDKKERAKARFARAKDDARADRDYKANKLTESDKPAATSIEDAQKWVDFDMKKYGKISKRTNDLVKKAGFQIIKDDHGDYEVTAGKYESLDEDFNKVEIETDEQKMSMTSDENGKVTVETEPVHRDEDMTIEPVSDETKAEIEMNSDEDEEEIEFDDFVEESFNPLVKSYLTDLYENVKDYKTTKIQQTKDNKVIIEGLIKFNSGKTKPSKFIFEAKQMTKRGRLKLIGENLSMTSKKNAFTLTGRVNNGKLLSESLNYNYYIKDNEGIHRIYGTKRK